MAARKPRGRGRIRTALSRVPKWVYLLAALALAVVFPLLQIYGLMDMLWIRVAIRSLTFVLLALGLNVVMGETGLLNIGYVAFFAIGAYTTALLSSPAFGIHWSFWPLLVLSTVLAMLAGALISLPTIRLRGDYLAIVTLAFGEIVRTVFLNVTSVTNGAAGIPAIFPPNIFGWVVDQPVEFYYLVLVFVVLVFIVLTNIKNSRIGRAWNALREDEIAAVHSGINATQDEDVVHGDLRGHRGHRRVPVRLLPAVHQPHVLRVHAVRDSRVHGRPGRHGVDPRRRPRRDRPGLAAGRAQGGLQQLAPLGARVPRSCRSGRRGCRTSSPTSSSTGCCCSGSRSWWWSYSAPKGCCPTTCGGMRRTTPTPGTWSDTRQTLFDVDEGAKDLEA